MIGRHDENVGGELWHTVLLIKFVSEPFVSVLAEARENYPFGQIRGCSEEY